MAALAVKLGAGFPHHIGTDPEAVRNFALTLERAGYDYLGVVDHVAGAHADRFSGPVGDFPRPPYTTESPTHEVMTLLGYVAALTARLELVTSVLVLPQRQTVLVAKQAAELAILSRGRLRLAVGVGWNFAEFEALHADAIPTPSASAWDCASPTAPAKPTPGGANSTSCGRSARRT